MLADNHAIPAGDGALVEERHGGKSTVISKANDAQN
jgi:hypothetical protein